MSFSLFLVCCWSHDILLIHAEISTFTLIDMQASAAPDSLRLLGVAGISSAEQNQLLSVDAT